MINDQDDWVEDFKGPEFENMCNRVSLSQTLS